MLIKCLILHLQQLIDGTRLIYMSTVSHLCYCSSVPLLFAPDPRSVLNSVNVTVH